MADNIPITPGSGAIVATREVTYSGEAATAITSGRVERVIEIDAKIAETQTTIDEIEGT